MQLANITEGAARNLAGNVCFTKWATIQDATQARSISTTGTATFTVDGVFYTKAALDNQDYSTGHDVVKDGYTCLFAWCLDAAGAVKTFQGQVFKAEGSKYRGYKTLKDKDGVVTGYQQELALVDKNSQFLPAIPDGYCVFAVGKVAASGADFTPGTTAHGTNNTLTLKDVMALAANFNF